MKKIITIMLAVLVFLTSSPAFAYPPDGIYQFSDGGTSFGSEPYRVYGDLTAAGLGTNSQRPSQLLRDDVRFKNAITGEFITDYFITEKFELIETEPGDDFEGRSGYHAILKDETAVKAIAELINGNPDFVWERIESKINVDYEPFVYWFDLVALAGGGPVTEELSDYNFEDGITGPTFRWTYPVTQWPQIDRFELADDHLDIQFTIYGGSYVEQYPRMSLSHFKVNDHELNFHDIEIEDYGDYTVNTQESTYETTYEGMVPLSELIEGTEEGERKITLYVEDQVGRYVEQELGVDLLPDFGVMDLDPGVTEAEEGQSYNGNVSFALWEDSYDEPHEAEMTLTKDGRTIFQETRTFEPGEEYHHSFNWTFPGDITTFRAEIWPVDNSDANPEDNVMEAEVYPLEILEPIGDGSCFDPAPESEDNGAPPSNTSRRRYILEDTRYEVRNVAICANVDTEEIIMGDNVQGLYQAAVYQIDTYRIETRRRYTRTICTGTGEDRECRTVRRWTSWSSSGSYTRRQTVSGDYQITASIGGTQINSSSGSISAGRSSFNWTTPSVDSTQVNQFTLTVTAPDGTSSSASSNPQAYATVFLPRGLELGQVQFLADPIYAGSNQIGFVRIQNTRDVGEEDITITYRVNGETVKTEDLLLPSGDVGANKQILRAFNFSPQSGNNTIEITASTADGIIDTVSTTVNAQGEPSCTDINGFSKEKSPSASFNLTYNYSTNHQLHSYVNSVMPEPQYNEYDWGSRTETYTETLEVAPVIDSWNQVEGKGRAAWEMIPLFGDDAQRSIRAGAGFELKVEVDYNTDFETRAPTDSHGNDLSLGVNTEGSDWAFGCFPYANYVYSEPQDTVNYTHGSIGLGNGERVKLEFTQGSSGQDQSVLELPEITYQGETKTRTERIHIVDKFYPDAYIHPQTGQVGGDGGEAGLLYEFYVVTGPSGITNLMSCHEDYVNIVGHIFDDIWHTRP